MKVDWDKVKISVERCLNAAKNGERGSMRVHCNTVERMLKGAKNNGAPEILDHVHHASTSIDTDRAIEFLEKAYALTH